MARKYDLIVIGSGPAGRRAAIQAAKLGKTVLVVEKARRVGGVSVHTGTIPSKTLRETVLNLTGWRERGFYGRSYRVKQDITAVDLQSRLNKTLEHEVEVLDHQFYRNKVRVAQGTARFVSDHEVAIVDEAGDERCFEFGKALVSVGTRPYRPDDVPFDGEKILDSDEIIKIDELPKSLTVIGAGVIGIEYATIFSALDVSVTVVEPRESILGFVDDELIAEFLHDLRDRGVALRFGCKVDKISREASGCVVDLCNGRRIKSDMVLFAAGRMGATTSLGLETCGLETDHRGRIKVDPETFLTDVANIYAAGDVIGFPSLASTSMEQGRVAVCHAFGVQNSKPPKHFPYGIYSVPEISTIGLTEQEVREQGIAYECGVARFRETSRGHIMGLDNGMLKMLFCLKTRKLLGVHIVGEGATELIHIGQAVLGLDGTLEYFMENTFNYPTLAEAYKIAGLDAWNRMSECPVEDENAPQIGLAVANG